MPRTPFDEKLAAKVPPDVFELPDGTSVNLTLGRYTVPELLMNTAPLKKDLPPGTTGDHLLSLPELISTSLLSSSVDIRRNLANNCVLAGGNTCYKGIQTRLNLDARISNTLACWRTTAHQTPRPARNQTPLLPASRMSNTPANKSNTLAIGTHFATHALGASPACTPI